MSYLFPIPKVSDFEPAADSFAADRPIFAAENAASERDSVKTA